eukprot:7216204-Alexandrium_andersonii.AAC.1
MAGPSAQETAAPERLIQHLAHRPRALYFPWREASDGRPTGVGVDLCPHETVTSGGACLVDRSDD